MFENIKKSLASNSILIEEALSSSFLQPNYSEILTEAQKYSLLGGGKRIRAFLVLEICRILGGSVDAALPYACAIEMIHASSLVHDDMPCMDNDDYRRGKPSTHKQFGETAALLAGDALIIKAFSAAIENRLLTNEINAQAIKILATSSGDQGMLAGQAIDTLSENSIESIDNLTLLHKLKTGQLILASVKLGCLAAGISEDDSRYAGVVRYAEDLGLSFQITDDILDYQNGKIESNSFLSFMSVEEAKSTVNQLTQNAIDSVRVFDDGTLENLAMYLMDREY